MAKWKLLPFDTKYTMDMQEIPHIKHPHIKEGDEYRLFLYKAKTANEIVHQFNDKLKFDNCKIQVNLKYKCLKTERNDEWSGVVGLRFNDHPLNKFSFNQSINTLVVRTYASNFTVGHDIYFDENINNTVRLHGRKNLVQILKITDNGNNEVKYENNTYKINLKLDHINNKINGFIMINIKCTTKDYHNLLQLPILPYNGLPSKYYHTMRVMYKVMENTNTGNYNGVLCNKFLSKDSSDLIPPNQIEFRHEDIFQTSEFTKSSDDIQSGLYLYVSGGWLIDHIKKIIRVGDVVRTWFNKRNDEYEHNTVGYFVILDIIDQDSFYGELRDVYYTGEAAYHCTGKLQFTIFKLKFSLIEDIPVRYQTEERAEELLPHLHGKGFDLTGLGLHPSPGDYSTSSEDEDNDDYAVEKEEFFDI